MALLAFAIMAIPSISHAYIGAGIGMVDEEQFGYTLSFGSHYPSGLGLDMQIVGATDSAPGVDAYWLQGNIDLMYDFYQFLDGLIPVVSLHPYVKGGFTYAATVLDAAVVSSTEVAHGPGFNFGGGVDVKLNDFITVGLDLTESIIYFNGVTVNGYTVSADYTAKVFNLFGMVKFFAY